MSTLKIVTKQMNWLFMFVFQLHFSLLNYLGQSQPNLSSSNSNAKGFDTPIPHSQVTFSKLIKKTS